MSNEADDFFAHHGVKGMKWGVRHDTGHEGERAKTKTISKADAKFEKAANSFQTAGNIHIVASAAYIAKDLDRINNKPEYKKAASSGELNRADSPIRKKYDVETKTAFALRLNEAATTSYGTNASGTREYEVLFTKNADHWKVRTKEVGHASDPVAGDYFITRTKQGVMTNIKRGSTDITHSEEPDDVKDFLSHYGVLGMHWGQHKATPTGASASVDKLARKDAKRHVDAKLFYGKTAGTRRKLLKAETDKKRKDVTGYSDAFDHHITNVDTAKSAKKAVRTRTRKDVTYRTRITTKQFLNVTGPLTVAAAGLIYSRNKPAVDNFVKQNGARLLSEAINLSKKVR